LDFTGTGQIETRASAYWRQRVQPVAPVTGRAARFASPEADREPVHGPALYVTLSPMARARLEALRLELAMQRARR
jgi:hypothetical protein